MGYVTGDGGRDPVSTGKVSLYCLNQSEEKKQPIDLGPANQTVPWLSHSAVGLRLRSSPGGRMESK